jgi:SAM-dependent methyltransferase
VDFVQSDLYDAVDALEPAAFDLVYTGIGAICWLPDIDRWAEVIARLLAPGGLLFMREGHPMLWSLQDGRQDDLLVVENPYFETEQPYVESSSATYVQTDQQFQNTVSHSWNHGLGEIISGLLSRGLQVTGFTEHDSVPWDALPGLMELTSVNEYRLRERPERLAHSYTLQMRRPHG